MSEKVKMNLVQGTVTFTIPCNELIGLVSPEIANDEKKLKDWLTDKAFKMIDISYDEAHIDLLEEVTLSQKTANKFSNTVITPEEFKTINKESKDQ